VIIVTGGAGFIGSNIVADLNELGVTDIVIVDCLGSDAKWRNLAKRRFLDIVFPEELDGYLDIGAHHPVHISNTYLLYLRGSRGINVEANPALIKPFNEIKPEDINLNIGVSDKVGRMTFFRFGETSGLNTFNPNRAEYVEKELGFPVIDRIDIDVTTVSEIVSKHWGGEFPDYLSLDVEGLDYAILNSIDYARSSPKLVSVEANDGEAVTTITELMIRKGYHPHFRIRGNLLFLRKDCKAAMFPE
jgi:FkbM family methyltransferase